MEGQINSTPLVDWSLTRAGRLHLVFRVPDGITATDVRLLVAQREDGQGGWSPGYPGLSHEFAARPGKEPGTLSASLDLAQVEWHDARWDVVVLMGNGKDDSHAAFELKLTTAQRRMLYRHAYQAYLPDDGIVIPYLTSRRTFALIYRERAWYDSPRYHALELAAWATYRLFRPAIERRRIWIVYEKQCQRAQDNGFYFFKWCMENLPPAERARIYYVIDPRSPDHANVRGYGRNVIRFMSFRHFLYCLGAEMLVGSETKIHLSPQRSRPGYTKHKLKKTMTFFLQHGVMAFKRTDKRMGATGWHPVDYFLVSSDREQDVITQNFGYDDAHVPVLGQARWDALEDTSTPSNPKILLMPTWREWLSDCSDDEFRQTDFYQNYSSLLNDPRLDEMLAAHNATLQVFLHPLFLDYAQLLSSSSPRVQVLQPGDAPLNRLIMGCSAMVTDYSSAVWDAIYQDKPALFFQFDRPLYLEKTGSYIDFDTDLPGECHLDADSLVDGLTRAIEGGFVPTRQQRDVSSHWFAHRDRNNCRRIYECALEIERSLGKA